MNDLIERLLGWSDGPGTNELCQEAADALEAQAKRIAELESALSVTIPELEYMASGMTHSIWKTEEARKVFAVARAAVVAGNATGEPAAPAQPAEPVAWRYRYHAGGEWRFASSPAGYWMPERMKYEEQPLYPAPPQPAVLTDEQIMNVPVGINDGSLSFLLRFARAVLAAQGGKP